MIHTDKNQIPASPAAGPETRLWPVATIMTMGIFSTTFVQLQGLGYLPFNHLLIKDMGLDSNQAATFMSLAILPWTFKAIAGLLVDGVPLFGSRRRAYLLLSSVSATVLWLAMGMFPKNYNVLLGLVLAMNTAIVFGSTTSGGLLVEAGQKFGISGRLSSLRVFGQSFASGFSLWVGGLLAGFALIWTSMAAILPLACMFVTTWLLLREPPAPARRPQILRSIWFQIKNVLRRQMILPALLLFFIQAVPTFRSTCFYEYQTKTLNYSDAALGVLGFVGCGVSLLSSWVYVWWCRRANLRVSLYGAILITSLSALPYLFYSAYTPYMPGALVIESIGTFLMYFAYLPLMDLAVRTTPKGSEALGYSLFISVWNIGLMIGTKTGPALYEKALHRDMNHLIWLNALVTLAGAVVVLVLPAVLVDKREGEGCGNMTQANDQPCS